MNAKMRYLVGQRRMLTERRYTIYRLSPFGGGDWMPMGAYTKNQLCSMKTALPTSAQVRVDNAVWNWGQFLQSIGCGVFIPAKMSRVEFLANGEPAPSEIFDPDAIHPPLEWPGRFGWPKPRI